MIGAELGKYKVLELLAKGGMASVYVGEHSVLGHKVAIKVLHPRYSNSETLARRFFNEAKIVASLNHPGIVSVRDFGRGGPGGKAYLVMDLLEGESLRNRMRSGPLDHRVALIFARQIAEALAVAHKADVIHRDLKPDNVFLTKDPEVVLGERATVLDFGISKQVEAPDYETQTGVLIGTPKYMSPEQCRGEKVIDHRADIYSLGVVLFRMLTGELPFDEPSTLELLDRHVRCEPTSPSALDSSVSEELDTIVLTCLEKSPEDRYDSMTSLAKALADAGGHRARSHADVRGWSGIEGEKTDISPAAPEAAEPALDESTHPTTLRHASGEKSNAPEEPSHHRDTVSNRSIAIAAAAAVLGLIILVAQLPDDGGGQTETPSVESATRAPSEEPAKMPAAAPTPQPEGLLPKKGEGLEPATSPTVVKPTTVEGNPIEKAPIDDAPIDDAPIDDAPIDDAPDEKPGAHAAAGEDGPVIVPLDEEAAAPDDEGGAASEAAPADEASPVEEDSRPARASTRDRRKRRRGEKKKKKENGIRILY